MGNRSNKQSWEKYAPLRPKLANHAQLIRQQHQHEQVFVLHNHLTGQFFRLSNNASHFAGLMNGQHSVAQLLELTNQQFPENTLSKDAAIALLEKLFRAEVLQTETGTQAATYFSPIDNGDKHPWLAKLSNPLAVKIPLFNPDNVLRLCNPFMQRIFTPMGGAAWLLIVGFACLLTLTHWAEIRADESVSFLSPDNLLLLGLAYPLVKLCHEFAHGFAVKKWGGTVQEAGIILLALLPVPYVDASAAYTFEQRMPRIIVSAAGILAELFCAALALFIWLASSQGFVHSFAYNIMLIGSLSTLVFNANPLLRYDGYYILTDLIGIPNLAPRAHRYIKYLFQYHILKITSLTAPSMTTREQLWFIGYGIVSKIYKIALIFVIILFIAQSYPYIGLFIACWACIALIIIPLLKQLSFLLLSPLLNRKRARAIFMTCGFIATSVLLLFVVPFPLSTVTLGVVIPPEATELRAEGDAQITELLATPHSSVTKDQALILTNDPFLPAQLKVMTAKLTELSLRQQALLGSQQQVKIQIMTDEIKLLQKELARKQEQADALTIRSPGDGTFMLDQPKDLVGQFVKQGQRVGYVTNLSKPTVRAVLQQSEIGLIRTGVKSVGVRLTQDLGREIPARIIQQVPGAMQILPSPALGPLGGGPFATRPQDETGLETAETIFIVELALDIALAQLGQRAYVRFEHASEPIGKQWLRKFRQLFLRKFNV